MNGDRGLRIFGWLTSACALGLLVMALATGGSQGVFQLFAPSPDYAAHLLSRADNLRWDIGLDSLFIPAYLGFFVLWARRMRNGGGEGPLIALALALVMMTAMLDAIENAHILAMLRSSELGIVPGRGEILAQQVASQVKFHAAYIGMAGLGMLWTPKPGWAWVRWVFVGQLFAGLPIFVTVGGVLRTLFLARAIFFVVGPHLVLFSMPKSTVAPA